MHCIFVTCSGEYYRARMPSCIQRVAETDCRKTVYGFNSKAEPQSDWVSECKPCSLPEAFQYRGPILDLHFQSDGTKTRKNDAYRIQPLITHHRNPVFLPCSFGVCSKFLTQREWMGWYSRKGAASSRHNIVGEAASVRHDGVMQSPMAQVNRIPVTFTK